MGTWSLRAHPSQDPKGGSSFQAKHRPQPPVLSFLLKTPADGMEASLMSSCKPESSHQSALSPWVPPITAAVCIKTRRKNSLSLTSLCLFPVDLYTEHDLWVRKNRDSIGCCFVLFFFPFNDSWSYFRISINRCHNKLENS